MSDTTIKKIDSKFSPKGEMGQKYLACGKHVSMRIWEDEPATNGNGKTESKRDYETVGYVLSGRAKLHCEGQTIVLEPGNSWVVAAGAAHKYEILETFSAVEATSPPAEVHGRDSSGSDCNEKELGEITLNFQAGP
jgi:quercetin dioxygenase-like cupin family protein